MPTDYTVSGSPAAVSGSGNAGTAAITNTLDTYSVTVDKTVTGDAADTSKPFNFTFNTNATSSTLTISGAQSGTITDGGTFSLKDGESVTISGIPAGCSYSVTEADYSSEQYTTTSSGDTSSSAIDADKTASFVNDRSMRTITVTKTWDDNDNEMGCRPTTGLSDVELTTTTAGGTTVTYTTNAADWVGPGTTSNTWTYTFMVDPAETATAISESSAPANYTCTSNSVSDTGWPNDGTAALTNTINKHALTVSNQVLGNQADKTRAFDYTFSTNASGSFAYTKTSASGAQTTGSISANGTFALKDGESIRIDGLPHSATYSVTEASCVTDGYTTTDSGNTQGAMDSDKNVTFTNTKQGIIPTGVDESRSETSWQTMLVGCLAIVGGWILAETRRRRRRQNEVLASE